MFTGIKQITATLALLLGVLILLSSAVQAQQQQMSAKDQIGILKGKLSLSDKQTKKITIILEDQYEEVITAINKNRSDRQALNEVMQEITKKTENRIKKVLTEEQVKVYNNTIKDRQSEAGKRIKSNK